VDSETEVGDISNRQQFMADEQVLLFAFAGLSIFRLL